MKIKAIIFTGVLATLSVGWLLRQNHLPLKNELLIQQEKEDFVLSEDVLDGDIVSDATVEHETENEHAVDASKNVDVGPAEKKSVDVKPTDAIVAEQSMEQAADDRENATVQDNHASAEDPQPDVSVEENVAKATGEQEENVPVTNAERVEEPVSHPVETPQDTPTPNTPVIPIVPFIPVVPESPQTTEKPNEEIVETPDRTDAEIKEVIDSFVDNFKNTKDFSKFTGTALEYIDENLDIIKNKPESNESVSIFIKNFKSGFTSKEELEFFLSEWLGGGGAYSKAITYSY